jgi:hypothetical protein
LQFAKMLGAYVILISSRSLSDYDPCTDSKLSRILHQGIMLNSQYNA